MDKHSKQIRASLPLQYIWVERKPTDMRQLLMQQGNDAAIHFFKRLPEQFGTELHWYPYTVFGEQILPYGCWGNTVIFFWKFQFVQDWSDCDHMKN